MKIKIKEIVNKIERRQLIFSVVYIAVALFIAFIIKKGYYNDHHAIYTDLVFEESGENMISEIFSFPAAVHSTALTYTADSDFEIIVNVNGSELVRQPVAATAETGIISLLYEIPKDTTTYYIFLRGGVTSNVNIYSVEFLANKSFNNDGIVKAVISFIVMMYGLVIILMIRNGRLNREQILVIVSLTAVIFFISAPLFLDYIPKGHDLLCHTGRIEGMKEAILEGQLIPVTIPTAFNGYGILGFEYPQLMLYIPALLRICGASMVLSYHVFLLVITIITAVVCYISVKSVLNNIKSETDSADKVIRVSLVATLLYMMSTYRLSDMYIRAALGETQAMAFLPLVVAGLYHLYAGDKKKWYMLVIGLTGIMQSHILTCCLIIPMIIILAVPFIKRIFVEKRYIQGLYVIGGFFLLNLWYIIPFIRFYKLPLNTENLVEHYVSYHLVMFSHLFAVNLNTTFEDGADFTLAIGSASFFALLLTACSVLRRVNDKDRFRDDSYSFLVALSACFAIVLALSSEFLPLQWLEEKCPLVWKCIQMLQFPYRFLTVASICLVFMLGIALLKSSLDEKYIIPVMIAVLIFSIYDSSSLIEGYEYSADPSIKEYTGNFTAHMPGDYLPGGVELETMQDTSAYALHGEIVAYAKEGSHVELTYKSSEDTQIVLPLLYYPCYRAVDENGNRLSVVQLEDKRLAVAVPGGEHSISLRARYSLFY